MRHRVALLMTAALVACVAGAEALPWGRVVGPPGSLGPGHGYAYALEYSARLPQPLWWDGLKPPGSLRLIALSVLLALLVVAAAGRARLAASSALPVLLVLGLLCSLGSPLPAPWNVDSSGVHMSLAAGYWCGLGAVVAAAVVGALALARRS